MFAVLLGGQYLFQQRFQLHLAKHAARLHVGQQVLQVAHALRQRLHLAQAFVHLLQPIGHLLEALAQARLQGALQFFVDRGAHLVELRGIALLELLQLGVERGADLGQPARIAFAHVLQLLRERVAQRAAQQHELLGKGVELGVLRARGLSGLPRQCFLKRGQRLLDFLATAS